MHLACGSPAVHTWEVQGSECDGRPVAVSSSAAGNCVVVLSQTQLQFWTGTNDATYLGSVRIEGATAEDDPATHLLWHPRGDCLVVATLQRRILFFSVSPDLKDAELLAPLYHDHLLRLGSLTSRVRFLREERLEFGILTSLASGGSNCFLACTTAGAVCVIGWFQQKLLHAWSCHSLSKGSHFFAPLEETGDETTDSDVHLARADVFAGSILDAHHIPQLKLTVLLLSNGCVLLAQSNVGSDFTRDDIVFSGKCAAAPGVARVSINSRHMLMVMATQTGDVVCKWIAEDLSLKPFWNGLSCLRGVKRLSPIDNLQWSPNEELLCVGFCHLGVVVVHYSGVCVYSSQLFHHPQRRVAEGYVSFSWSYHGHRLLVIEPRSGGFTEYGFNEIISSPCGDSKGCFTPVVAFDNEVLRLAGHFSADGELTLNETVSARPQYASDNYPMKHGAVSPDGSSVALAGRCGFVFFDRFSHRWRSLRDKNLEKEFVCVAQPLWLSNLAVVLPVRITHNRTFELRVYAHRYLDASALLTRVSLERMPLHVCECHNDYTDIFILVTDSSNALLLWRCVIDPEGHSSSLDVRISFDFIKRAQLPDSLVCPVAMAGIHPARIRPHKPPSHPPASQQRGCESALPQALFILRGSHALVSFDPAAAVTNASAMPSPIKILRSAGVYRIWVDYAVPMDGSVIVVFGVHGISILHLLGTGEDTPSGLLAHEYGVSNFDTESLPVGVSTHDGCLLTAGSTSEVVGAIGGAPPTVSLRMTLKPLLYNYRLLAALNCPDLPGLGTPNDTPTASSVTSFVPLVWNDRLLYWLESMRRNGTFVPNADYYLHTLITGALPYGLDQNYRRAAVQATVSLLRRYSEFYSVAVSCLRKLDVPQWRILLDVLGSPVVFFRECLENHRFEESAQLLRVIMLDGSGSDGGASVESLEIAMSCAVELLVSVLWQRKVHLLQDLLRFMALLHAEITMTAAEGDGRANGSGVWTRLLSAVGLQQDLPRDFSLETEPLRLLAPEKVSCGSANSGALQRRSAVEYLFCSHPTVRQAVCDVASESLFAGHLMLLRDMLQELFVSLPHFVACKTRPRTGELCGKFIDDTLTEDGRLEGALNLTRLPALFDGIHDELGLPRSVRCIGTELQDSVTSFMNAERTGSNTAVWTAAQSYLYTTPGMVATLLGLRELYTAWDECVLAVNVILMSEDVVMQQLHATPELAQALRHLTTQPQNVGYTAFVQGCIDGHNTAASSLVKVASIG
ncbi:uncharacterized protein Tco025E_06876 [Trypanosoma conorhini]|uniref:RIC1 C-terminal alpha solenoid region domain-containing protein n=1 Tax=Trypanosoma conorhini TaxID=83891 RepID=A0A422NX49_9TRYP|nr:uncharacterized protein Tco025E_06876 [Trypanosoma conorhini]RNF10011.1 hypothetical protein Tco025E_06876 [Trypanosoma conorhini]